MKNEENNDKITIPPIQEDDNTELEDASDENSIQFNNRDDYYDYYEYDFSNNYKAINSITRSSHEDFEFLIFVSYKWSNLRIFFLRNKKIH